MYGTYRLKTLHEFGRTLVVLKVFDDKHYDVVVFKLTEILDHQLLDEWLQLAINQLLRDPRSTRQG